MCIGGACYFPDLWWFYLLLIVAVLLFLHIQVKRMDRLTRKRAEESYPDGPKPVTYWVTNSRLYNAYSLTDGMPLKGFTALYAADGVVALVTATMQYFCFERKALSEADWSTLAREIRTHNPKFKAVFR